MNSVQRMAEEYARAKAGLQFFDGNAWLGNPLPPGLEEPRGLCEVPATAAGLLEVMDHCGIEKAVVTASAALHTDVAGGNQALLEEISCSDRLYGAAVLLPGHTGELGPLEDYLSSLTAGKVVMARLFPKTHNFVLSDYCAGTLLRLLEERRIPLALWHTQTTWDEIHGLCTDYPGLPVVIEGVGRKLLYDNRIFYPLLERHENLFIGTHNLTNYLGLDALAGKLGARKAVFGTFIPGNDPEAALMPVAYGDFSPEDKKMIAGGNLLSLVTGIRG